MDFCNNINFEQEQAECDLAFQQMDSGSYAFGQYIYYQEEKECVDQDNSIKQYIHCYRLVADFPQA